MKATLTILLLLFIVIMAGCYYESEEKLYPVKPDACELTNVTFSKTIKPILQENCFRCHSNLNYLNKGGGIKLENHADIKAMVESGKLMGAVKHESDFIPMPEDGGKLTECEINKLQKWVDNGILNN